MDPTLGLAGAGLGLLKGALFDGPQEAKQRQLQAATARFSPWTGLKPEAVKPTNLMGDAMQGGMAGISLGQNIDSAATSNKLSDAIADHLKSQDSLPFPTGGNAGSGGGSNPNTWSLFNKPLSFYSNQ